MNTYNNANTTNSSPETWSKLFEDHSASSFLADFFKGTPLETPTKLNWCYQYTQNCALSAGQYLAYEGPKYAAESAGNAFKWTAKSLLSYADDFIAKGSTLLDLTNPNIQDVATKYYRIAAGKFSELSEQATQWAIGDEVKLVAGTNPPEPFSIVNLIGPTILMGYCASKAKENGINTLYSTYLLFSGTDKVTTAYQINPTASNMANGSPAYFLSTRPYTKGELIRDITIEGLCTALWSAGGYLAFEGMKHALIDGGSSDERARWICQALLTAVAVGPTIFNGIKAAMESNPMPEGPEYAPFVYSSNQTSISRENNSGSEISSPQHNTGRTVQDYLRQIEKGPIKSYPPGLESNSQWDLFFGGTG